ncbi:Alpha/Beta hydrolase protein [Roridomyces roridus]|uniref:Alpha/Beta hydrolase protein n=1 Tax=Roridomyces roridus TaxID=1738132 RepID=A0AAD7CBR4_9AGAR|nr:Alpha/Beta hydrolase protein [Roridomyces roridus]
MKLGIFSLALAVRSAVCANTLTVNTPTGSYTGLIDPKFPNTRQFRSVAFAEPPVTSRRWLPPVPLANSIAHHFSYNFPASCPQFVSSVPTLWNQFLAKGNLIYNGDQSHTSGLVGEATSEDCLYLAVWTPANATVNSNLPVLFFMTGGGFQTGGVFIEWQLPASWVERTQEHIVVTINYRLNIFGFPNARGLTDQNLGILDQRMALEWVRDNIASFGGDASKIVQWGQSAGSQSTDIHAYAFHQDPIARGYFMQSGDALDAAVVDQAQTNFSFVARHSGCDFPFDPAAELDCMRPVPFALIENFIGQYGDNGTQPALTFSPVVDEKIVFSDPVARAAAGMLSKSPAIISNCANEEASLYPYPVNNLTEGPYEPAVLALDLSSWVCPTATTTRLRNALGIPVFRYQNAATFPNLNPLRWLGAYHASDLPTVFGTYGLLTDLGKTTSFEVVVSEAMQDHILAFVKDPEKGPQKIGWPAFNASSQDGGTLIRFGADGKVVQLVDGLEVDGPCEGIGKYNQFP